ncbi:hypothetical protein HOL21_03355 [Candidatus Woesearchaeota archaeon]|jgi:uncharacterized protein|nr:hypothetical protein [Candidatus Woesearchaeota archaeon]MBT5397223.1 hypothetical protein [Candidatus Woesearchaeota archaeon]MBT5924420.1 hypothetical protein [Candidatus Woesearchaeota archaeon]MBT6367231.1 hypothetical protein [Candidatus Woesearchaeota archaeon]MBT7762623.1 hypothetical protein [Candidatus Woesearchaeota archaeon]
MVHFYESSIITTKDGLQCQVYGNEHPFNSILVKPKYIPTDKVESDGLQYRFISGKKMNRLNMWSDKEKLRQYLTNFKIKYPQYVLNSPVHTDDRLFFSVPIDNIERIYYPRKGFSELISMPEGSLDDYLKLVHKFATFLLQSGLRVKDLGITYSTLMGHYNPTISDINIVVYGKENFWKLMKYLETAQHELLRWKTKDEWISFHKRRNRYNTFSEDDFYYLMNRKKSEGFFNERLFVIFAAEKEEETWFQWGEETYTSLGNVTVEGTVTDNFSSVVRPGCYDIKDVSVVSGSVPGDITKVAFYSRDYCMMAYPGEKIQTCGVLERVDCKDGSVYYRIVVGYFDAYMDDRREKEYIKVLL